MQFAIMYVGTGSNTAIVCNRDTFNCVPRVFNSHHLMYLNKLENI